MTSSTPTGAEPVARRTWAIWLAAVLLVAGAVSTTACGKKSKNTKSNGTSGKRVDTRTLALFPNGTELVIGVNKSVREGKLFGKVKGFLKKRLGKQVEVLTLCNIDIVENSESVMGGGKMGFRDVLMVVKGFTRADLEKCEEVAKAKGKTVTVKHDKEFTAVVLENTTRWVAWVDDTTFIAGPDFGRDRLAQRLKGENGLDKDPRVSKLLDSVDTGADIWWAGAAPDGKPWKSPLGSFVNTRGAVSIKGGLDVDAVAGMTAAKDSKTFAGMVAGQLSHPPDALKPHVKKVKVTSKDADLNMSIKLSDTDIDEIAAAVSNDDQLQMIVSMAKRYLGL